MKRKTKLAFEELARELKIVPERDLLNILGGSGDNGPGPEMKIDSQGRTYYTDNTGRIHYLIDTNLIFEGIMDSGKSFATWAGTGWDLLKGSFNLQGTGISLGYNAMENVFNEWRDKYFLKGDYVKVGDGNSGDMDSSGSNQPSTGNYPGVGLPPK